MIEVGITATVRPKILKKTLQSFKRNLFSSVDPSVLKFSINIDPIGVGSTNDMIEMILYELNGYAVFCSVSDTSSFSNAFCRVWGWALKDINEFPYFFNLEDDWELLHKVDLNKLIAWMERDSRLAILRLPMFPSGTNTMKNWNLFYEWNSEYYECPEKYKTTAGFCGHPSLIRKQFMLNTLPLLDSSKNPEKQFHQNGKMAQQILRWDYGVIGNPGDAPYIRDIGRDWMEQNSFRKKGNKAFFTKWTNSVAT